MRLLRSTAVVGGMTMASRVLGFFRDVLMASAVGAGPVADAFVVAFRFPNLFRRWFAEGAFNAAFVPLYSGRLEKEGEDGANQFASDVLAGLLLVVGALVVVSQLAMPWLMRGLAPGYFSDPAKFGLTVILTQITMPYLLLMSVTAMVGGALNANGRFVASAGAPILLNIILIAVLFWTPEDPNETARRLSFGVTASGVAQAALLIWAARRSGIFLRLKRPRWTPGVKRLVALGVPGAFAAGVTQINLTISQIAASFQDGANALLYFADRLYQLPLGVIGIGMGVVLLPVISRRIAAGDERGAANGMNRALEFSMALTLPAAAAMVAMPEFLVEGLFQRGEFGDRAALGTALAVEAFAVGLPAFVLIKVLSPAFFAREDTKTPMKFAAISMVVNVVLGVGLFVGIRSVSPEWQDMGHVGLAAATSVAGWVNAILLAVTIARRGGLTLDRRLLGRAPRILAAVAAMSVFVWYAAQYDDALTQLAFGSRLLALSLVRAAGAAVYGLAAIVTGALKPSEVLASLKGT
ncbi:MAG: murein biosynthesis integral membrane protein MurJ [Maricaulis sp.]|nr:murein biosynthesis integral membrane protein MurJ [Maricaulis sp.]